MRTPVLLFNAPRSCYRDILVAEGEHYNTRSPSPVDERFHVTHRPRGRYDATKAAHDINPDPSVVVCQWDCEEQSIPYNLAGIKAPRVLIIGDTHHTPSPLTRSVRLALAEPWDLVVLEFNERHLHWFHEAGVKQAVYIPCWSISPVKMAPPEKRTRGVTFCGNIGPDHVYRRRVLAALKERGVEIEVFSGLTREQCAKVYNESLVSLNISLNGDFNLRNYEIAAAGGCMVSDFSKKPTSQEFINVEDLINSIHSWSEEKYSLYLGRFLFRKFWEEQSPKHKIEQLMQEMEDQKEREVATYKCRATPSDNFWQRLAIYERVQEFVMRGIVKASDFGDLARWAI